MRSPCVRRAFLRRRINAFQTRTLVFAKSSHIRDLSSSEAFALASKANMNHIFAVVKPVVDEKTVITIIEQARSQKCVLERICVAFP